MWIRSQDKTDLADANFITYANDKSGKGHHIVFRLNDEYLLDLGKYKSKKRCIEILDEIQNIIKNPMIKVIKEKMIVPEEVYQMPKE